MVHFGAFQALPNTSCYYPRGTSRWQYKCPLPAKCGPARCGILQDRLLGVRTPLPHIDVGVPHIRYDFGSNHEVRLAFTSKHVGLSATQGVGSPGQGSLGGG